MNMENLIRIENGEKAQHTFTDAEYANRQRRQRRLRELMARENIDAVLFASYHNINYYADFLYCSFGRKYGLVVTPAKVVSISANIDGGQPWRHTVGDYNVVYTDWQRDNFFRAVQAEIDNRGRVGIEFDHVPVEVLAKLKAVLPSVEFVDVGAQTMRMRMIKSDEEIALIRHGANVCDIGGAALAAAVREGVPEHEAGLKLIRPRARCGDIARELNRI
jgi:creatinase